MNENISEVCIIRGGKTMDKLRFTSTKKEIIKVVAILFAVLMGLSVMGGLSQLKNSDYQILFNQIGNCEIFIIHEMSFLLLFVGTLAYLFRRNKSGKIILFMGTLMLFIYAILSIQVNQSINAIDAITSNQMFINGIETLFGGDFITGRSFNNLVIGICCDIAIMIGGIYMIENIPWKKYYSGKK